MPSKAKLFVLFLYVVNNYRDFDDGMELWLVVVFGMCRLWNNGDGSAENDDGSDDSDDDDGNGDVFYVCCQVKSSQVL